MNESEQRIELVTHYNRYAPNESNSQQKRSYLETNILPLLNFFKERRQYP